MSANNYKTALCKSFPTCPKGDACTFAHGVAELVKTVPCWFFNNGGCRNSPEQCPRLHEVADIRKPVGLQRPCNNLHQNGHCRFGSECRYDHFELSEDEWRFHYQGLLYPGEGYLAPLLPVVSAPKPEKAVFTRSDFPALVSKEYQRKLELAKELVAMEVVTPAMEVVTPAKEVLQVEWANGDWQDVQTQAPAFTI